MATASPEPQSKAGTHTITESVEEYSKLLHPEGSDHESDSPSGQVTTAAGSDTDSNKGDIPHDDDDEPKSKPRAFSIDPSKSPSLNAFHHISPDFVNYITLSSLHNYLNRHHLLTRQQSNTLSLVTIGDIEKINLLIEWLPQKGTKFFDKFIKCLRESAVSEKIDSHRELADLLESARDEAKKRLREFDERTKSDVPNLEPADGAGPGILTDKANPEHGLVGSGEHPVEYTPTQKDPRRQKYYSLTCLVSLSLFSAVALLLVIILFVLLAQLPQFNKSEIRPLSAQKGMTVELSFGVRTEFLAKGSLGIDNACTGGLYIISGMQCPDLYDEYTISSTITDRSITFHLQGYWLLLGSRIEYTLYPSSSAEVWLFTDESFYTNCEDVLDRTCSDYPLLCHQFYNPLETPSNRTIQINESGNYFQCFSFTSDQIDVTVYGRRYNIVKIEEMFGSPIKFDTSDVVPFSFNNSFLKFSPSCVLFHVDDCFGGTGTTGYFTGSVSKRFDAVFFGGILLFIVIVVFIVLMSVCVYRNVCYRD